MRLPHFAANFTGQIHEARATFRSIGSFIPIFTTVMTLAAALGH
ncbi:MAG TPA: hypothetical protein VGI79_15110 [Caulobacteraceae bacterium]